MIKNDLLKLYGPIMTIQDLADVLHANKRALYNRLYRGQLEVEMFKVNNRYMVETSKVAHYIENQKKLSR